MAIVIWGNRKLFSSNERGVQLALKHPLLKDKSVIGRGVYSIILGDGISIFKLTIDRAAYALAASSLILGVYSRFGMFFIFFPFKNIVNFTPPLEDYFSGEAHTAEILSHYFEVLLRPNKRLPI